MTNAKFIPLNIVQVIFFFKTSWGTGKAELDSGEKGRIHIFSKPKIHCILAALLQFLENEILQNTKPVENTIHWTQMRIQ